MEFNEEIIEEVETYLELLKNEVNTFQQCEINLKSVFEKKEVGSIKTY